MIFIVVKHRVRPEYADDWPGLVREFTVATRAEPGNLFFDWYRSADDPNIYLLTEAFRDQEAGRRHVESDHFKNAMESLPNWLSAVPEIVNVEVPGEGWSTLSEMKVDPGSH
jgi:quinol monooxygenase YgiN